MTLVSLAWNCIIPSKVSASDDNEPETARDSIRRYGALAGYETALRRAGEMSLLEATDESQYQRR